MSRQFLTLPIMGLLFLSGCGHKTPLTSTIPSPDGTLLLSTDINQDKSDPTQYLCVVVEIRDKAGKVLFHENTHASSTQRWTIEWISNHEILLNSSDIGRRYIRWESSGKWRLNYPQKPA